MHIRNSSARLNTGSRDIVEFLEQARVCLRETPKEWANHIGLTKKEYQRILARRSAVPIQVLLSLCEKYELSIESVQKGAVDLDVFYMRSSGAVGTLPERYKIGAFSRRRTGAVLFKWLGHRIGFFGVSEVMRHFQVDPATFCEPLAPVNLIFFSDVMQYTSRRFGVSESEFEHAGALSWEFMSSGSVGNHFRSMKSVSEAYERGFTDLRYLWENNGEYTLGRFTANGFSLKTRPRQAVLDELNVASLGSPSTCSWRTGVFSVIPKLLGAPAARVKKTGCIQQGDLHCSYDFEYDNRTEASLIC